MITRKENRPCISIVVPVYNVEKYLDRCVESLVRQSLSDIQIVLVDDGSTDCSGKLCDKWADQDTRIKVIHKRNGGLSSARNAGMQVATGSYIGFVDSDDAVEPNMYEKMYKAISDNHASFVMSDYMRVPTDGKLYLKTLNIAAGFYDRQKIKKELFPSLIILSLNSVCTKNSAK